MRPLYLVWCQVCLCIYVMPVILESNFKGCLFVIRQIKIMIGNSSILSESFDSCFLVLIEGTVCVLCVVHCCPLSVKVSHIQTIWRLLEYSSLSRIKECHSLSSWFVGFFSLFWCNLKDKSKGKVNLCFCVFLQTLPSRDASFPYKTQLPCVVPASTFSSSEYSTESKILDYVQELDSSFHPVLSFPSGK